MILRYLLAIIFISLIVTTVHASKLSGTLFATKTCPAYKNFRQGHNPGDIQSIPGRIYQAVEENIYKKISMILEHY